MTIGMAASIETLGTMAANRGRRLGHTGSAALADWTTNRLIQAVRLMVSVPASRSTSSIVFGGRSSRTGRRRRVDMSVI
jgi:hypothetical protein